MRVVDVVPLHETARQRYLNYALSVITSRALPDIRDGLKPVQRRILYAMFANLRLYPDGRHRKSATIVGEVMGKYHPHGDSAIYDAMVRLAQDFNMRMPLVDGQGNFGSIDGDSPAAMRYTEVKLAPLAMDLLEEIRRQTVDFRPNFDGTLSEPVVLPARIPNLLVNGGTGIAVGMATNIPPHNLGEVVSALIHLIGTPNARTETLVSKYIKAPDFPTGGRILNSEEELLAIYEKGEGPVDIRGDYALEGKNRVIVTSIPYSVTKSSLIESIADRIIAGKVPQLIDVRDESTDEIRIVLELKRGANVEAAMAYLFKHTALQTRFHVNMTCLVPTDRDDVLAPQKVDLKTVLRHFLDFRFEVVTRRLRFDLEQLEKRIHILKGFEKIFKGLDEAIKIIRSSEDKSDAGQRLQHRFGIDDVQAEAILETKLFKLSRLEIDSIRKELAEKQRAAKKISKTLNDDKALWLVVKNELKEIRSNYADERRSVIDSSGPSLEYSAEDYIVDEDVYVIVTRDGWVKRQRSYTEIESIRVREGDEVGWAIGSSTRAMVAFFSNYGKAYTLRVDLLTSTTGYGDPVQKIFDFADRERIAGVISMDPRVLPDPATEEDPSPELFPDEDGDVSGGPYVVAVSKKGQSVRLPVSLFSETSTRSGRRYMRLADKDEVLRAEVSRGNENVCLASRSGHALIFPVNQISVFKNAAKGVIAMRLTKGDEVAGFTLSSAAREGLEIETSRGRRVVVRTTKFEVSRRGNKGRQIIKRGGISAVFLDPIEVVLNGKE